MPENIKYLPRKALLSYEEMERLMRILAEMGVNKVRITGGEPFVRKDLIHFLQRLAHIPGLDHLHLTTNGVLTQAFLPQLLDLGIRSVNLSLDTLDPQRFHQLTLRDEFAKVWECLHALIDAGISTKINAVIMEGKNTDDILPMAELTRDYPISVRYIEEMPFNGKGKEAPVLVWNHRKIKEVLQHAYPDLQRLSMAPNATAVEYQIPGAKGKVGIIAAFSRTFCGTCNRIRITAQGQLKTCLYDQGVLDLRGLMRAGASDQDLKDAFLQAFGQRAKDGFEAAQRRMGADSLYESMSTIGG